MALELDVDVEAHGVAAFLQYPRWNKNGHFAKRIKYRILRRRKKKGKNRTVFWILLFSHSSKFWWPFSHLTFRSYPYICQCVPPVPCACLNRCLDLQWKKTWFTNPHPHMLEDKAIPAHWWCLQCAAILLPVLACSSFPPSPLENTVIHIQKTFRLFSIPKNDVFFQFLIACSEVGKMTSFHLINKVRSPAPMYSQFPVKIFVG